MLLRAPTWKTGLVVLGGCCLAVVIVAGASARTTAVPVDHQLCYSAVGKFNVPKGVRLIDQFSPNGFVPSISSTAVLHCNPVIKTVKTAAGQTQIFRVTNPAAHLACFPIASQTAQVATPIVQVTNQFGNAILQPKQPNLLCVPSWKSLTGPPKKAVNTPPKLNHFTCYPVTLLQGGYKVPGAIALRDEFSSKPVRVQVNPVPQELCLPTEKIVPNATGGGTKTYPIINPALHLLCFGGIKTPHKTPVWDENQFGTSKMIIRATKWLCLPSTKKLG